MDKENTLYIDLKDGRVVIEMRPDLAPKHVAQIKKFAREGKYDGVVFHRVIEGFMAQSGDPNTVDDSGPWGGGGPGYSFGLEIDASLRYDKPGVLGMARANSPDRSSMLSPIATTSSRPPAPVAATPGSGGLPALRAAPAWKIPGDPPPIPRCCFLTSI